MIIAYGSNKALIKDLISVAKDLTVNEISVTIPDPDSVPFPKENCLSMHYEDGQVVEYEDEKICATFYQHGETTHVCQGIMTHLTNETFEELNEDIIIDVDEVDADNNVNNNANNNTNEDVNEDD